MLEMTWMHADIIICVQLQVSDNKYTMKNQRGKLEFTGKEREKKRVKNTHKVSRAHKHTPSNPLKQNQHGWACYSTAGKYKG